MFKTLRNAFKIKDIRDRILYTFFIMIVIRIGSQLPIPGVDRNVFANWFANQSSDAFNFFDAVTGGSFYQMSVFALNITPYITSSIIMQLLTIAIPKLEEMQKEGEEGRKKIAEFTRYLTVVLALIESVAMAVGFGRGGYLEEFNALNVIMVVTALTAGSAVLMWFGERITEKGIGNGISIVLVINIISRLPEDLTALYQQFISGKTVAKGVLAAVIVIAIIVAMVVFVILLQDAQRKIPVQYSKKIQGRKILKGLSQSNWCDPSAPVYSIGLVVYIVLIIAFAYFYTSITFNPLEIANNMKKAGGFIPGIRPGKPTSDYLTKLLNYIVFIGAVGLAFVAFVPIFFDGVFNANVSFGGTSIIIIVGVVIETIKQIESQMLVRYYKGFLND